MATTRLSKGFEFLPLKIFNFNAQGLIHKFDHLSSFVADNDPDIVIITETWLDPEILDSEFTPDGYKVFRKDRDINIYPIGTYQAKNRGGVLILVKAELNPVKEPNGDVDAEIIWIRINPVPKVSWLIGGCYRPEVEEEKMLDRICRSIDSIDTENCILLGDFNFRNIDWPTLSSTRNIDNKFLDTIKDNLLNQVVTEPTRGENILDLALVGNPDSLLDCSVCENFSTSDHNVVLLKVSCPVPRINSQPRKIFLYSKGDYEGLNKEFRDTKWEQILDHRDIEVNWERFVEIYNRLLDKYIPHKFIKPGARHKPPWTRYKSVNRTKSRKRSLFVKARQSGLYADKLLYENFIPEVEKSIYEAKSHYEDKLVERLGENPKLFFNYVRHFSRSSASVDTLRSGEHRLTHDTDKAELLNSYFTSVLVDEPPITGSLPDFKNVEHLLFDFNISPQMVRDKLSKLRLNKASGPDNVHVNVLSNCLDLDKPLAMLFDQSMRTGRLPQDWRDADVTPLHKKGSREIPENYRPVSLTSQVVKLLERVVLDNLQTLVKLNKTINCAQHGFQECCSCLTQLLECLNDWTENYDNLHQTDIIYLDFSKAFDSVPHQRLIYKLRKVGVRGKVLDWIEAFLTNRRQRVVLRNGTSGWQHVKSGVPQGSILGPLLFLIYVNDMPDSISSTSKMFADDTKAYREIIRIDDCQRLQEDLNSLQCWSLTWLLGFNASKCILLRIRDIIKYIYSINGEVIKQEHTQKDLGVLMSDDLKPAKHVEAIVKKANQRIGLFKRSFTGFSSKKVSLYYKHIIRPVLEYGAPAWNPWHTKDIQLLEKTQDRCLKLSQEEIKLESLEERRKRTDLIETYKYLR